MTGIPIQRYHIFTIHLVCQQHSIDCLESGYHCGVRHHPHQELARTHPVNIPTPQTELQIIYRQHRCVDCRQCYVSVSDCSTHTRPHETLTLSTASQPVNRDVAPGVLRFCPTGYERACSTGQVQIVEILHERHRAKHCTLCMETYLKRPERGVATHAHRAYSELVFRIGC